MGPNDNQIKIDNIRISGTASVSWDTDTKKEEEEKTTKEEIEHDSTTEN